jgi:hypothetical protein
MQETLETRKDTSKSDSAKAVSNEPVTSLICEAAAEMNWSSNGKIVAGIVPNAAIARPKLTDKFSILFSIVSI